MHSALPTRNLPGNSGRCLLTAFSASGALLALLGAALPGAGQSPLAHRSQARRTPIIPAVSHAQPGDRGVRMHTNVRYMAGFSPSELPPFGGYGYETPASLACIYGIAAHTQGCNPNQTTQNPTGGGQTIAIVDAYDDPNAAGDLAFFSSSVRPAL